MRTCIYQDCEYERAVRSNFCLGHMNSARSWLKEENAHKLNDVEDIVNGHALPDSDSVRRGKRRRRDMVPVSL